MSARSAIPPRRTAVVGSRVKIGHDIASEQACMEAPGAGEELTL